MVTSSANNLHRHVESDRSLAKFSGPESFDELPKRRGMDGTRDTGHSSEVPSETETCNHWPDRRVVRRRLTGSR